jgi:hypothetical protein
MAGEFLALAEKLGTDHAEVLLVVLVPAVNLPRQLLGEEALSAMPVLLRSLHPLRTEGTLELGVLVQEVVPHVPHELVCVLSTLPILSELIIKLFEELENV